MSIEFRLGVIICFGAACGANVPTGGETDDAGTESEGGSVDSADTGDVFGYGVQLSINRDVDVLFVIDNSGSMGEEQGRLAAGVPAFLDVLEDPAVGANYRIGVTTTDNGNPWCSTTSPEAGHLVLSSCRSRTGQFVFNGNPPADATEVACTDVCSADAIEILPTTTEYDPEPRPRSWVERVEGETNIGGDLAPAEALGCTLPQGIDGCGFESHLESMYKALLRAENSDEEQYGFLRANAVLSIVIVSDEVDCSYNADYQSIFLPEAEGGNPSVFWSDPEASAPTSAVCWNAGVHCEGSGAPYDSCSAANKDTSGNTDVSDDDAVLHPVARYRDYIQEIEIARQQITPSQEVLMALVTGVPEGGGDIIYTNALDPVEQGDYGIAPGCTFDDGDPMTPIDAARPPVRERDVAESFEVSDVPNLYSICQQSYTGPLEAIAESIADQLQPACMTACVADTDQVVAGLQPMCTLVQEAPELGEIVETVVPQCGGGESVPADADVCFVPLVDDALTGQCADEGWNLEFRIVRRPGVPAPSGTSIGANCQLSQNKAIDCPLLP